jgi:hypothetical protein
LADVLKLMLNAESCRIYSEFNTQDHRVNELNVLTLTGRDEAFKFKTKNLEE